jgi:large subunit ribosomal protein L15
MLNSLQSPKSTKKSKRLGRGIGSGVGGHTVGRGGKGATARSGYQYPSRDFEGGQMRLSRRLPRLKGITSGITRKHFTKNIEKVVVKLSKIEEKCKELNNYEIDINKLVEYGLFKPKYNKTSLVKILFDKEVNVPLKFTGLSLSKRAEESVVKAGGEVKE